MEEATSQEKSCCGKGKRCCGGKALAAAALLAVGALGGYFGGRHCAAARTSGAVAAPSNPSK